MQTVQTVSSLEQIWRHGDRAPANFYPTDPNSNPDVWPFSLGQLTNLGKQQQYRLGQWLRDRYADVLLPESYDDQTVFVRSTDVDRTLDSAYSNLAGLFPPTGDEMWNDKISWQPIPVHTVPVNQDWLLAAMLPACPVYDQEYSTATSSPEIQKLYDDHKDNINYVLSHAGFGTNDTAINMLGNMVNIRDDLFIESIYKKV